MSKRDLKNFGTKLREFRKKANLTQFELAELLDFSPNFIGMVERGERNTTVENIFNIARALKIKPKDLFDFKN